MEIGKERGDRPRCLLRQTAILTGTSLGSVCIVSATPQSDISYWPSTNRRQFCQLAQRSSRRSQAPTAPRVWRPAARDGRSRALVRSSYDPHITDDTRSCGPEPRKGGSRPIRVTVPWRGLRRSRRWASRRSSDEDRAHQEAGRGLPPGAAPGGPLVRAAPGGRHDDQAALHSKGMIFRQRIAMYSIDAMISDDNYM